MTTQRLLQIQDELKTIGINKIQRDATLSERLSKYHNEIFHSIVCTTCPGVLVQAYQSILNFNIQKFEAMSNRKYSIAKGQMIDTGYDQIPGVPIHVNNDNITDEIAEKLIKHNPNFKAQLLRSSEVDVPADKGKKGPKEPTALEVRTEEIESMTVAEIKEALDKAKVEYKASATKSELVQLLAASEVK